MRNTLIQSGNLHINGKYTKYKNYNHRERFICESLTTEKIGSRYLQCIDSILQQINQKKIVVLN